MRMYYMCIFSVLAKYKVVVWCSLMGREQLLESRHDRLLPVTSELGLPDTSSATPAISNEAVVELAKQVHSHCPITFDYFLSCRRMTFKYVSTSVGISLAMTAKFYQSLFSVKILKLCLVLCQVSENRVNQLRNKDGILNSQL